MHTHKHHKAVGTRAEVMHGTAKHTSGGLTKKHLMKNKHGRIVSRKMHDTAKRQNRLAKSGYVPVKGQFKLFHKWKLQNSEYKPSRGRRGKGHKGGMSALSPASFSGQGDSTSGVDLQFMAGNGN